MKKPVKQSGNQHGQALPVGVALIMFTLLTGIVLHNSGQQVSEKTRLANTADAAVYSGLVWQTRALNFQSYTNRAMVANQVTIAQAVSLRSWTLYGKIATENINTVLGNIPYLGAITNAMATVMDTAESLITPITDALLSFVNAVNGILTQAQTAMYGATFVATPEIVRNIAKKNDPDFSANTAYSVIGAGLNARDWKKFTQKYDTDNSAAMNIKADVINSSTDRFSNTRDWEFFNSWFYIGPIVKVKMHKRGTTRLISTPKTELYDNGNGESQSKIVGTDWEWKAKDTLSLNTVVWRPFRSDKKIETPIGWGQAFANAVQGDDSIENSCRTITEDNGNQREECDRWFGWNRSAEYRSDKNVRSPRGTEGREKMSATYNGIRAYRDLVDLGNQAKDPRLVLRVEIESPIASVQTSTKVGFTDTFSVPDAVAGDSMASIASGEVFFKKPVQAHFGQHIEYANGFNPFWDVRLINTPDREKLVAYMIRNVPVLQGAVPAASGALADYVHSTQDQLSNLQSELAAVDSYLASASTNNPLNTTRTAERQARKTQLQAEIDSFQQTLNNAISVSGEDLLAGAGFDQNAIASAQQRANSLDPASFQAELERLVQEEFNAFKDKAEEVVKDKIKEELENALKNVLKGAVKGATGVDVDQLQGDLEVTYNSVNDKVDVLVDTYDGYEDQFNNIATDADVETQKVEAEFDAIKENVAQTFDQRKEELAVQAQDQLDAANSEIASLEDRLINEILTPEEKVRIEEQLALVKQEVLEAPENDVLKLAELLVEVVNNSTDIYELTLDVALELVQMEGDIGGNLEDKLRVDCTAGTSNPSTYVSTIETCNE